MRQVNNNEWVSVPTMPQLIKDLIGSTEIKTQCEIDAVRGEPGNWYLIEKQKDPNQAPRQHGPFQKVVLTAPAPQALNLLRNLEHNWACPLKEVQYSSCWVLLKTIRHNPNIKFLPSRVFSSIRPQKFSPDDTHFNNISSWIAYTEPTWSHRNLELEAGEILEILSEEFFKVLNDGRPDVLYSNVHRWRYAQVTQSLKIPFLYDSSESLFYVSDSCLGNGIEGALSSGLEVGTYLCDNLR
jgi:predicted NAD/FAD-dependent oxidoreductase